MGRACPQPDGTDHPDVNSHNHVTGGSGTDNIALVDAHLRDGSTCTVYIDIEAGRHNVTGTSFQYNSENGTSADYKATGTTQAPHVHGPSDGYQLGRQKVVNCRAASEP